jgi:hypothetical protein
VGSVGLFILSLRRIIPCFIGEAAGYHCILIWKKMPKEAICKVS